MVLAIRFQSPAEIRQIPGILMLILFTAFVVSLAISVWMSYQIKRVYIYGDHLLISDYKKEIAVPLSDIYDVTEMRWMQPYWITITFRRPTEFGDSILFIPPFRMLSFWVANPLVEEIRSTALSANSRNW